MMSKTEPGGWDVFLSKSEDRIISDLEIFERSGGLLSRFQRQIKLLLDQPCIQDLEEQTEEWEIAEQCAKLLDLSRVRDVELLLTEHKRVVGDRDTVATKRAVHESSFEALRWCAEIARRRFPLAGRMTDIDLISKFTRMTEGKEAFTISIVGRE